MPHKVPTSHKTPPSVRADLNTSSAIQALARIRVPGVGVHPSRGTNFNNTLFGRDSAITSRELLDHDPEVAHDAILALATLQGTGYQDSTDEEPGRIHHENREFSEWHAPFRNKTTRLAASIIWGGTTQEMNTYFSMDSTPLYVLMVADYAKKFPSILDEVVTQRNGEYASIKQSLIAAADWMVSHITSEGLVEIARHNKYGLTHQTWKDSLTSYIHENGDSLNLSQPIAYIEVQSLVVDALSRASDTLEEDHPEKAAEWWSKAALISQSTIRRFWDEKDDYFVSSMDRNTSGELRKDGVEQSDPGWMLNSAIFDGLPEDKRQKFVTAITRQLFSPHFLTDAGIRSRSVKYIHSLPVADYHGAYTTWPLDTYFFAKGLRRQGLPRLAEQLESRILNAVNISGEFFEFYYVEPDGTVLLNPDAARKKLPGAKNLPAQFYPEEGFGWTIIAALVIKHRNTHRHRRQEDPSAWQTVLEDNILSEIKHISPIKTVEELQARFKSNPGVYLDFSKGMAQTMKSVWEAFRPRLPQKQRKLAGHAVRMHTV
ncbi:MAG: amylo-alpha-1,6-glucosidase [Candidatus Saccharimonadales bacterium]